MASPSVGGAEGNKAGAGDGGRLSGQLSQQQMYQGMAGRMEIIMPSDISLNKFLGSGGYGEVRAQAGPQEGRPHGPPGRVYHVPGWGRLRRATRSGGLLEG